MALMSDSVAMRAAALVDLVEGNLEVEGDAGGPQTAWPMVGPALLAHATSSLRSIVFRLRVPTKPTTTPRAKPLRPRRDLRMAGSRPAAAPRALAETSPGGALEDSPRVRGCRRPTDSGRRAQAAGTRHCSSRWQAARSCIQGSYCRQALESSHRRRPSSRQPKLVPRLLHDSLSRTQRTRPRDDAGPQLRHGRPCAVPQASRPGGAAGGGQGVLTA